MKKTMYSASKWKLEKNIPGITKDILKESFVFNFKNGEFITKEMDELTYLFIILEGRAKVIATQDNGKRIILQFLRTEDLIGDLTIIEAEETIKDVISMGDTVCLGIPIDIIRNHVLTEPDFLLFLSRYIGKKLLLRMNHFKEQQTQELKVRLAKLLLEVSTNNEYHEKHTEIAEYLGVSYRHFMHTFKYFKEEALVTKNKKGYIINPKMLKSLINELS